MPGINFDPLADDDMAGRTEPQGDMRMWDDDDDGMMEVGHSHSHSHAHGDDLDRVHADETEADGPDDLDRRNRVVMLIDHAVSIAGLVLCIACVVITANTLISPLGL